MNLLEFIDKGGIIVYILIFLNIIGFTIIIWKFTTLPQVNKTIAKIASRLDFNHSINAQIEYEVKKLETGLVIIKNIAIISPLLGLLGTVVGIYSSFEEITIKGLGIQQCFQVELQLLLLQLLLGLLYQFLIK